MEKLCLVVLLAGILYCNALPAVVPEAAPYEIVVEPEGYHFSYKTEDSGRDENGVLEKGKGDEGTMQVTGSFNFIAPNGNTYEVTFVADENGYRPKVSGGAKLG